MRLKGISLSIETIVIIIVCVLVLVVVVLFFTGVFNPGAKTAGEQSSLSKECLEWGWHFYSNESYNCSNYTNLCNQFGNNDTKARNFCLSKKE